MNKALIATVAAVMVGGCKMKEFSSSPLYSGSEVKFTGAVEDRVNLWPAAYWREPVGSIAWPLISWGDDHLAFRPIYSQYRQGGGDYDEFNVLWPISQFDTKHSDHRFFPAFWGSNHGGRPYFCLFPAAWWNRDFAGVLPVFWKNGGNEGDGGFCVFPLYWAGWAESSHLRHTLWPLYYYRARERSSLNEESTTFWAACGLAGFNRVHGEFTDHRVLPLYLWNRGDFYSLPYSRFGRDGHAKNRILCGIAGMDSSAGGEYDASWLFPLYYHGKEAFVTPLFGKATEENWLFPLYYKDDSKFLTLLGGKAGDTDWVVPLYWRDKNTFASLPYWRRLGDDGEVDVAFSIPLLSGYERDRSTGDRLLYLFLGLGGRAWNDETGGASWAFPLYYKDRDSFYTLLCGHNPSRRWLIPFYLEGPERMYVSPLYGRNKKTGADWFVPLYYRDDESFITPLFGKSGDASWVLPLYCQDDELFNSPVVSCWHDAKKGTRGFFSLPILSGATWNTDSRDKTWFTLAGLVGSSSDAAGEKKCEWALPLFIRENGRSFHSLPYGWSGGGTSQTNLYFAAGLAAAKSGKKNGGWLFPVFRHDKDSDFDEKESWMDAEKLPDDINVGTNRVGSAKARGFDVSAHDKTTHFLLSCNDKHLHGRCPTSSTNRYELTETHEIGNKLIFGRDCKRKVTFDAVTRDKVGDEESDEASFLLLMYNYDHKSDRRKGTSYASHRVLWKLWDWEKENGDVSLDVFPGFTYDSKKNGYRKTSLLWRFFRYENDPEDGKKVDVLFIPVLRQGTNNDN